MLGGASGLNGLLFTASTKAVINGWAELGNPGWTWSDFSQSLAQTYTVAKTPAIIGKPGSDLKPLQVSYADKYIDGWPKVWAETMETLGFPGAQDTLMDHAAGGLMIPETIDPTMGARTYAANAYMSSEVRGRINLMLSTGVEVKKVLFEKPNTGDDAIATCVEYIDLATGTVEVFKARREVIISAGVFGSPKLLELSGVGNPERLGRQNVVVDLSSVGVTSAAQLPLPGVDSPQGEKELEEFLSITTQTGSSEAFGTAHEKYVRDILSSRAEASGYYIFGPAYAAFNPDGTSAPPPMNSSEDSYVTIVLILAQPLSRGSVHVVGVEGAEQSLAIDPGFLSHPLDLEVMARHLQFIERDLVTTEPLLNLFTTKR